MTEEESKLERRRKDTERHWFNNLPERKQDEIIHPAFEKEHPTNKKKREAEQRLKRYEWGG